MQKRKTKLFLIGFICMLLLFAWTAAAVQQDENQKENGKDKSKIKPYEEVITAEAVSDVGVFTTHIIGDKLYYEIPENEIGRVFLWVIQYAKVKSGAGYSGFPHGNQVVRWDRKGDRILLRQMQYDIVADEKSNIYQAVKNSSFPPVVMAFDIAAFGENNSMVIDVTSLYTTDIPELSPGRSLDAKRLDSKRSFIERVASYPENIETEALLTFDVEKKLPYPGMPGIPGTVSVVMHHSMIHLPENPMMPRLSDDRCGFFGISQEDYGIEANQTEIRRYITRWRLEKKNPEQELSEPIKPIVFYADRSVPEKWIPYVIKGIEAWQEAFEQAGFKNAIIGKRAPSVEEDPDWNAEDARISTVSWVPSMVENAFGPHVHDPRTGEILEADVKIYNNVMHLAWNWYFVQCGAADPRIHKLPVPDEIMGEMMAYIITHEVGHSLGLPHNFKASAAYTAENLRNAEFTAKNGNSASLMDYSRFNYVAQPGDNARLIPIIGPYDRFIIEWGYKPVPGAETPDEELPELEKIARRTLSDPFLRFNGGAAYDPSVQTEDIGSDPVEATRYGIMNIKRIVPLLIPATYKDGEDFSELKNLYDRLVGQLDLEINHVVKVIGGVEEIKRHFGQEGEVFQAVSRERQKAALDFLQENIFQTPEYLLDPQILDLIEPSGNVDRITMLQGKVLANILRRDRIQRMIDVEALEKGGIPSYSAVEMMEDLRTGIWSELDGKNPQIDSYRRNLQRAYVSILGEVITGEKTKADDFRALARGELKALSSNIARVLSRVKDPMTRIHLDDVRVEINGILNPKS